MPPGFVQGPLLFLLTMNYIESSVNLRMRKITDGTDLYAEVDKLESADLMQQSLNNYSTYLIALT